MKISELHFEELKIDRRLSDSNGTGNCRISRLGVYLRTSVDTGKSNGLRQQLEPVIDFAIDSCVEAVVLLADPGYSGRIVDRPAFLMLWQMVQLREVDAVAVQFTDRLGRRASIVHHFLELCRSQGVTVFDVGNAVILEDHAADVQSDGAEQDYQLRLYRSLLGVKIRVLKGLPPGKLPFGFVKGPGDTIEVDPSAEFVVVEIFLLACMGASRSEIAQHLNAMGRVTPDGRRAERTGTGANASRARWTSSMVDLIIRRNVYRGLLLHGLTMKERDFDSGRVRTRKGPFGGLTGAHREDFVFVDDETWLAANSHMSVNYASRANDHVGRRAASDILTCSCGGRLRYRGTSCLLCKNCGSAIHVATEHLERLLIAAVLSALPNAARHGATSVALSRAHPGPDDGGLGEWLSRILPREAGEEGQGVMQDIGRLVEARIQISCPDTTDEEITRLGEALEGALLADSLDHGLVNTVLRQLVTSVEVDALPELTIRWKGPLANAGTSVATVDATELRLGTKVTRRLPTIQGFQDIEAEASDKIWATARPILQHFGMEGEPTRALLMQALTALKAHKAWDGRPSDGNAKGGVRRFMERIVRIGAWDAIVARTDESGLLEFADPKRIEPLRRYKTRFTPAELEAIDRATLRALRDRSSGRLRNACIAIDMKLGGRNYEEILRLTGMKRNNVDRYIGKVVYHGVDVLVGKPKAILHPVEPDLLERIARAVREGVEPDHPRPAPSLRDLFALAMESGAIFPDFRAFVSQLYSQGISITGLRKQALSDIAAGAR